MQPISPTISILNHKSGAARLIGLTGIPALPFSPLSVNPDGSLVYYGIHLNDFYAYMASAVNSKELTGVTQFPTSQNQRDAIVVEACQLANNLNDADQYRS